MVVARISSPLLRPIGDYAPAALLTFRSPLLTSAQGTLPEGSVRLTQGSSQAKGKSGVTHPSRTKPDLAKQKNYCDQSRKFNVRTRTISSIHSKRMPAVVWINLYTLLPNLE
jgi:hypothetical protein